MNLRFSSRAYCERSEAISLAGPNEHSLDELNDPKKWVVVGPKENNQAT